MTVTKGDTSRPAARQEPRAASPKATQEPAPLQSDGLDARGHPARTAQPLPVLLAHVLLDINREFERGAATGEDPSLLVWANLLRVIPDMGIRLTDLAAEARISRRALKAWLRLEGQGWLTVDEAAPRAKVVLLSETGRELRDRWRDLIAATERAWAARVGGTRTLREALEALVARVPLELPHYPMVYGASDTRALGGTAVAAKAGPPRIPAHGADWVPVLRTDAGSVADLPLHALVSQALMAFTIDYEEEARFSMAVAALLGQAVSTPSVPLDTLPRVLGVTGAGKSALERHGLVQVSGKGTGHAVSLTDRGVRVRDAYQPTVTSVTRSWRARYGDDIVNGLATSLADVQQQLSADLPDHVVVRYTSGPVFRDVSFTVDTRLAPFSRSPLAGFEPQGYD